VGTVHGLQISLGVPSEWQKSDPMSASLSPDLGVTVHKDEPVRIEEDNNVRSGKVDAETPGAGGEQEHEFVRIGPIVIIDGGQSIFVCRRAIDTAIVCREPLNLVRFPTMSVTHCNL
jgi:hypothetical protein